MSTLFNINSFSIFISNETNEFSAQLVFNVSSEIDTKWIRQKLDEKNGNDPSTKDFQILSIQGIHLNFLSHRYL